MKIIFDFDNIWIDKKSYENIVVHNIHVDSCDSLPPEKTMTFHNVIILTKSDFNKDKSHYYYNILFPRVSDELPQKCLFLWNINAIF